MNGKMHVNIVGLKRNSMDDLIKVSEMIRKYPKALSIKDNSKDDISLKVNTDSEGGKFLLDLYEKHEALQKENGKALVDEMVRLMNQKPRVLEPRVLDELKDEMDKSRLKDDDGYTICMSFGADCFDTNCPKAK